MALVIGEHSVVSMHYKLTDDKGTVIDTSEGAKPLAYLHGAGNILPGLEKALVGKTEGESLRVRIEPSEGYGEVNPDLIKIIERKAFDGMEKIEAGMAFQAKAPDGSTQNIIVTKVDGDDITIDSNHPLAGITLNFDIQIIRVREATKEELDHGHTHEGGHSH